MRLTERAHVAVAGHLQPGALAVDATAGNGHDTAFLAERVGPAGHVWAFDVQAEALAATRARLDACGLLERVTLLHRGHEGWREALPPELRGQLTAVMFNLGYLPGGDQRRVTSPVTTLAALNEAVAWLAPGGIVSLLVYRGHAGGLEEHAAIERWLAQCPLQVECQSAPANNTGAPLLYLLRYRACPGGSASSVPGPVR